MGNPKGTNSHEIGKGYKRSPYIMELFTPKKIIFNAIKDKLSGTGIIKLVLVFNVITDRYNIMLSKEDNKTLKLKIEEDEITMIKKLFVRKIENKYKEVSDKIIKDIIIEVDFRTEDIKIFIQDMNDEVERFDYKII